MSMILAIFSEKVWTILLGAKTELSIARKNSNWSFV